MNTNQRNGLKEFERAARCLWKQYLSGGPGSLDATLWDELKLRHQQLSSISQASPTLTSAIQKVMELARRCAERPEGLSFVTAEAGLIPRHAEHREFEQSLIQIAQTLDDSSI